MLFTSSRNTYNETQNSLGERRIPGEAKQIQWLLLTVLLLADPGMSWISIIATLHDEPAANFQ